MIRNYIKIALRQFKRNQITSMINLLGLSLGLATCLVAGLYVKHELSADKFHEDLNSVFRVTVKMKEYSMNGTPYLFTETVEKEIPEVTSTLRTSDANTRIKINDEVSKYDVLFADSNFLTFFTFPLELGNRQKALEELRQVVISHEMKMKYFGDVNPLGRSLQIEVEDEFLEFEITGVAKPTPAYSSIHFDFVVPLDNKYVKTPKLKEDWGRFFITSFIKVSPGKRAAVEENMQPFVVRHLPFEKNADGKPSMNFILSSLADHHLNQGFAGAGLHEGKNGQSLFVFGGIAIIILLLACFNFMNLTNAQSSRRAIEVGIKKIVGAVRFQLMRQFLAEAIFLSCIAALMSLGIAELSLILFGDLLQASISVFDLDNIDVYAGLFIITLFTGILAGTYPAFVLSNLNTLAIFKRHFRVGGRNWLTRSILSVQFGLSIILIVCAIVMWKQQKFISEKDLGYNEEQVLTISVQEKDTASIDFLKNEIRKVAEALHVSKTSSTFAFGNSATLHQIDETKRTFIYMISADADFLSTMEVKLVSGQGFENDQTDQSTNIIVNETLIRELNLEDSIGVRLGGRVGYLAHPTILGVVKDFHVSAMKYKIAPVMILHDQPLSSFYLMVRLAPGQTQSGLEKIREVWNRTLPDSVFEFSFLDDDINSQYEAEIRWSMIITLATGMAIFLSVLGLLGLAMFTAQQRRKEISIRKVLGASLSQLVNLLSRDYLWLIAIAFVLAIPASYYLMTHYWLDNFAYKIEIDIMVYCIALLVSITALSIGSQTLRAAMQNPADTLKEE